MNSMDRPLTAVLTLPLVTACVAYSVFSGRFIPFTAFLVALLVCCFLYALGTRFGISLEVQAPSRVLEGDEIDLSLLLNTRRRFPRFVSMSVAEIVVPEGNEGSAGRHGASSRRRHRLFYQHIGGGFRGEPAEEPGPSAGAYRMQGFVLFRGHGRVHRKLEAPRRGVIRVECLRLRFSDPLGVFALRRTWRIGHEILVRIRPPAGGGALQITGGYGRFETHKRVGETGDMTEYAGTRPYRPGDELRHLHWSTIARTGEWHVREYTPTSAESVVVLLLRDKKHIDADGARYPVAGETLLKATVALVMELFDRRIDTAFGCNIGRHGFAVDLGYSQRNLQRFHDYISALSWTDEITVAHEFAGSLTGQGSQTPMVVVFAVDPMNPDMLRRVTGLLRVDRNQVTVVVPDLPVEQGGPSAENLSGWRVARLAPDSPASIFRALTLS